MSKKKKEEKHRVKKLTYLYEEIFIAGFNVMAMLHEVICNDEFSGNNIVTINVATIRNFFGTFVTTLKIVVANHPVLYCP